MNSKGQNSFTQILDLDNSMLIDLDIESLNKSDDKTDKPTNAKIIDKRKSSDDDIFKSPSAVPPVRKKRKSLDLRRNLLFDKSNEMSSNSNNQIEDHHQQQQSKNENEKSNEQIIEPELFSEELIDCIEPPTITKIETMKINDDSLQFNVSDFFTQSSFSNQSLTQATDCIKDAQDDHQHFVVTRNPETSSQYVESKQNISKESSRFLPVSSVFFKNIGPWFGLTNMHKLYLLRTKGIEDLYDWQKECLDLRAIHERRNLIYALPTSGGKTLVAEIAMFREVLLRNKNVMFILPFVSIVHEKTQDLASFAVEYNFLIEEYCAGKGPIPCTKRRKKNVIYICTIEKGSILFDSLYETKRLNEIGLIVVDELHLLGDSQRGYILESMLTKAISNDQTNLQVIGMSATISNLSEVAQFLNADIYTRDFRPVELTEYAKIGNEIFSINQKASCVSEAFEKLRECGSSYNEKIRKRDPDHLLELVMEVCPKFSCLIFCATKKNCESVSILLCDLLPNQLTAYKGEEKKNLIDAIKMDLNGRICPTLKKTIPFGVAYHHSGLMAEERRHIEEAYRLGIISIICCTSTLAAGVNLPAKRVIIRSPYIGANFITLTKYKQMVGRAGRAGKCDSGESIVICEPKDLEKLTDLLCSKMDETVSGYVNDTSGKYLKTTILNLIGLKAARSIDDLVLRLKPSLLSVQIERVGEKLRALVARQLEHLVNDNVVSVKSSTNGRRFVSFTSVIGLEVFPDDELDVSQIGRAAVNSGLSIKDAKDIEIELRKASELFVFTENVHLFMIIVPSDIFEAVKIDYHHCSTLFTSLQGNLARASKAIGITETLCGKMISRQGLIKENDRQIIKRFFIALIMLEMWSGKDVYEVSRKYNVNRGLVNGILSAASAKAFSVLKFCEVMEEFWGFRVLLQEFSKRLTHCCSVELLPLMELPGVKIGRAKMMFNAGLKTVADLAILTPTELCQNIKNLNLMQASKIIKAAKLSLLEEYDTKIEKAEEIKNIIKAIKGRPSLSRPKL